MHAVLKTGGKQYRVTKDDVITIERVNGEPGSEVSFEEILILGDKVGSPFIKGAVVSAEILEQKKDNKIIVFKKKRRKDYKRTLGHKQMHTVVKITSISSSANKKKVDEKKVSERQDKSTETEPNKNKAVAKKAVVKKKTATKKTAGKAKAGEKAANTKKDNK
ncbi:MAG: 50S ribosomal protein L21 [Alphaproteobacteria bacterium TMED87]|nr:50S ribosomal protein L21 [Rhodospirillaceae bacterium]OUV09749.1 MAG: 50S ribosomal protein L21 [Alphaproteobacteria bacterium TMED87]